MSPDDFYGMGDGEDFSPAERQQAIAAALQKRQLGMLGQATGDSVLSGMGQGLVKQADASDAMRLKAGENRLLRRTETQRNAALSSYHQGLLEQRQAEETRKAARDATDAAGTISAKETADGTLLGVNNRTGEVSPLHVSSKRLGKGLGAGKGGAVATAGTGKQDDKDAKDFDDRMSASGGRAGALGQDYVRLANAQNLKTILHSGNGTIPPPMVAEATAALGRLVTGGAITEGTMEKMIPHTAGMDLANKIQYITGNPQDGGVRGFLDYMGHTADREAENATERMKAERLARLTRFAGYHARNGASLKRQAKAYGLTEEEVDRAFATAPTAAPSPAGGSGQLAPSAGAAPALNPGEVLMRDAKGVPHAVPEGQVQAALAHKWTKG